MTRSSVPPTAGRRVYCNVFGVRYIVLSGYVLDDRRCAVLYRAREGVDFVSIQRHLSAD